ncbi:hypothetical protein CWS72_12145 [Telmatospirillum siberiense]|uniref:Methylaspartate ammonia-lyase n=1 Tax=Telmatospirillum siberiense TaxID=382514 RepID=A0A2N3PVG7_9PROT|nr:hypothetical protein CWS72_12145 [Telmatospirillum siberiense]
MASQPAGPVFLASYPTAAEGPLHGAAFLYDNAAAAIALVGCGRTGEARRIGDAILLALDNDRFWHDGRLRNAYAAGAADAKPLKLSGWWDPARGQWLEDRYQVGSDVGNMAWAMLALLALDRDGAGAAYAAGAERIGRWVAGMRDERGGGGYTGGTFGHEPSPEALRWKSTEHNTDLAAAFTRLEESTGRAMWRERAEQANAFVRSMWDGKCGCFAAGTGEDGVTRNPILALDAQVWPLLALAGGNRRYAAAVPTVEGRLSVQNGFAYGEARDGIWTEGTAQMALLYSLSGRDTRAIFGAIGTLRAPDGYFYATNTQALPTGFMLQTDPTKPRLYYRLPHLGATAWIALAERRFNPFTGTTALPPAPAQP